jgi:hypothetical protein
MVKENSLPIEQRLLVLSEAIREETFERDTERIRRLLIRAAETIIELRRAVMERASGPRLLAAAPAIHPTLCSGKRPDHTSFSLLLFLRFHQTALLPLAAPPRRKRVGSEECVIKAHSFLLRAVTSLPRPFSNAELPFWMALRNFMRGNFSQVSAPQSGQPSPTIPFHLCTHPSAGRGSRLVLPLPAVLRFASRRSLLTQRRGNTISYKHFAICETFRWPTASFRGTIQPTNFGHITY